MDKKLQIACDDAGGDGLLSELTFTATIDTTYFIRGAGAENRSSFENSTYDGFKPTVMTFILICQGQSLTAGLFFISQGPIKG